MIDAPASAAARPNRAPSVFAAFLAARAAFGLVYITASIGKAPVPWYYPLEHAWEVTGAPHAHAMGWFGLTAVAGLAALVTGLATAALARLPGVARALERRRVILGLAHAGALVLAIDFLYFGWALANDERRPWTEPACDGRSSGVRERGTAGDLR